MNTKRMKSVDDLEKFLVDFLCSSKGQKIHANEVSDLFIKYAIEICRIYFKPDPLFPKETYKDWILNQVNGRLLNADFSSALKDIQE